MATSSAADLITEPDPAAFEARVRAGAGDQIPGYDFDATRIYMTMLRATSRVRQDIETRVLRPSGLSWASFRLLGIIYFYGPITSQAVARLTYVSPTSVSAVLRTLERHGLLVRTRMQDDARLVALRLTDRGKEVALEAFARANRRERDWAAALSQAEQDELVRLLRKVLAHELPAFEGPGLPIVDRPAPGAPVI